MIVDLSSPAGGSIDYSISEDMPNMQYALRNNAINIIQRLGREILLVKLDIMDVYHIGQCTQRITTS